jgi:hypothetical protein
MAEYKHCSYSLRKAIKQAKCQCRDKFESQFNSSDTRCMQQGLQTIMDYKWKTSHVEDTYVLPPDKLYTFLHLHLHLSHLADALISPTLSITQCH